MSDSVHGLTEPRRILCADDDPIMREILRAALTMLGYDVTLARDGQEAWEKLTKADAPHLVVLDWIMPRIDGLEVVRKVREANREPYTYFILLTARLATHDIVQGMNSGADDYITKPFDVDELSSRIRAGERIVNLYAELFRTQGEVHYQATHDALTYLYNRGSIMERLDHELARGRRSKEPVAVVIVDLDHFKSVNDAHGHRVGDEVLREVARRMSLVVRSCDAVGRHVGRYGGEEFLIILSGTEQPDACRVAERIRAIIADRPLDCPGELQVPVTASFGVAVSDWKRPVDADDLIEAADLSLYRAKGAGRNKVEAAT